MCGIVGYVGDRACRELLLQGLERLEYRGYDSAGVSLLNGDRIESVRSVGLVRADPQPVPGLRHPGQLLHRLPPVLPGGARVGQDQVGR